MTPLVADVTDVLTEPEDTFEPAPAESETEATGMWRSLIVRMLSGLPVAPMKTRPQDGMPFHNVLPRLAKSSGAQILRQRANHLFDVHTGVRRGETVVQHALLHRRQRVALRNSVHRPDLVSTRHICWRPQ